MTQAVGDEPPWVVEQRWEITYRHAADPVAARFFRSLRDDGRLLGARCPECERILVPARPTCDRDFCDTAELVDVGAVGTIELFTIVYHRIAGLPDPPYVVAYVRPDGADTAVANFVRGVDLTDLPAALASVAIGNRVAIRFADERKGDMTDFYFEVLEGGE
jgi:uncharacterized OB-fold protein